MSPLIKVKHVFFPFFFQQERDYKNGSLSSYASLLSVSIFTIFSSTCDWNTHPLLLLGYVSRNCSLLWTRQDCCNGGNKCVIFLGLTYYWKGRGSFVRVCAIVVPPKLRPPAKIVTAVFHFSGFAVSQGWSLWSSYLRLVFLRSRCKCQDYWEGK